MAQTKTTPDIFRSGSTWVRADFHLHTKADGEFKYTGDVDFYSRSYVDALIKAGIRIGAITNHNKFDKQEFDTLRKTAQKKDIMLLPGVELSVSDGIHVNIVFCETWLEQGHDYINPFLSAMFIGKSVQQYQTENGHSDKNLLQVVDELEKVGREYFLIYAHVEDTKGLWAEVKGRLSDWEDSRYQPLRDRSLGFQKVRTRDLQKKVKTWLGSWYPAEVEGSDCKSIEEIGKGQQCFLKIGSFNFEAVRFALRDYVNRVAKEPTKHKRSYIKSIRFDGGTLNGHQIDFSSELNTLIGIRGSGKSSIIEAIRYGLDIPFGEKAQDSHYKQELIKHTLGSGGAITITAIDGFGQEYEVRRIWDHSPEVFIDNIQQPGVTIRETVISKPLYFGQKDLSSSGEGFEKDLVEKLLGAGITEIRLKIEEQKARVQQAVGRYQKLSDIASQKEDNTQKKQNADFQLERYKKYGLEEKLQKQVDFDADARKIVEMNQTVVRLQESLSDLLMEHEDSIRNHRLYKSKQNTDFFIEYFSVYQKALKQLETLVAIVANLKTIYPELAQKSNHFAKVLDGLKEEFATTERTIAEELKTAGIPSIRPDEFRQLSITIEQTKAIIDALDKEQAKSDTIYKELLTELSTLNELWHQEFKLIETEMEKVNANHSSLSINVGYKADKEAYKKFLQDMMRGSGLRETVFDKVKDKFVDMTEVFKNKNALDILLGTSATAFWEYFTKELETFLVWKVPNKFAIKYKDKELREHSLGQRSSALILFVLSQKENDVILIDQPEDDLDNQTIYQDVIKLIAHLKLDTQFIFATHNPNFPVLGDAEMVVSCEYINDQVIVHPGSIDDKKVQERIVNIMEGGEEAFNRRKEIYGIWKPQNFSK